MITDNQPGRTDTLVMFRIISRHDRDRLQRFRKSCPCSTAEHLYGGMYVLVIPDCCDLDCASRAAS